MSLAKSTSWFALGTLLSRFSGLARDAIVAGVFGATAALDAFFVAFRIPNLLRDMLAEGALSGAFTKVYSGLYESDRQAARQLLADALRFAFIAAVLVCGLGILFAEQLVDLMTIIMQRSSDQTEFRLLATDLTKTVCSPISCSRF